FGTWAPIGAVQTASGYDIAWKDASDGLYTVWSTDSNGNYEIGRASCREGEKIAVEAVSMILNKDLNGDPVIGLPTTVPTTGIEVDGATSLTGIGLNYQVYDGGPGWAVNGAEAAVTQSEFGTWAPIGAVQTASGYDIAWKDASDGLYTVWSTDSNGNY